MPRPMAARRWFGAATNSVWAIPRHARDQTRMHVAYRSQRRFGEKPSHGARRLDAVLARQNFVTNFDGLVRRRAKRRPESERHRMSDTPKPPIIIYCSCNAVGRGRLYVGYLGQRQGASWCFPDEQMASDGFELYDAKLEPLPDLKADREVYLLQPAEDRPQQVVSEPIRPRRKS